MHDIALVYVEEIDKEYQTEMVKAEKVGDYYRIPTFLFSQKHLAIGDLISVETEDSIHYVDDIIEKSGNTTIRILVKDKVKSPDLFKKMTDSGAILHALKGSDILVALDIPNKLDYNAIRNLLDLGQEDNTRKRVWDGSRLQPLHNKAMRHSENCLWENGP
ncbi:MAG TPA: DUF4265 domain-containing protein [Ohtaekwangia sp.]|uniref:DUF4265 domain-containing protein n=1 Tax=Ohtaekwangia sp. TaxID=2066019 RepID=UPI002F953B0B